MSPSRFNGELIGRGSAYNPSAIDASLHSLIWAYCKKKDLLTGTRTHHEIQKKGLMEKTYSDALVIMYAKCGELQNAQVFLGMHGSKRIIPWTALIARYTQQGLVAKAQESLDDSKRGFMEYLESLCLLHRPLLDLVFCELVLPGMASNGVVIACINGAISNPKESSYAVKVGLAQMLRGSVIMDVVDTEQARIAKEIGATAVMALEWVHADIKTEGGVVQMSDPELIKEIKDAVTILVMAKAKIGLFVEAQVLEAIGVDYIDESEVLIPAADDVNHINKHNFCIPFVCGYVIRARRAKEAFYDLSVQHTVMWIALITAYVEDGYGDESLYYFKEMQFNDGVFPDDATLICTLRATMSMQDKNSEIHAEAEKKGGLARDLLVGSTLVDALDNTSAKKFHADAARRGIAHDVFVGNTLVSMYEKCGEVVEVEKVFFKMPLHSVVSWYLMISSYLDDGQGKMALQLFSPMHVQGANYNHATSVLAFQACSTLVEKNVLSDNKQSTVFLPLDIGRALHAYLQSKGFAAQRFVANTLVSLYGKCKAMAEAENAFASVLHQDEVLATYIKQGQELEALQLYVWMQRSSNPDRMSLMVALQACAVLAEIYKGYHEEEGNTINNIIVSMYGKCGAMKEVEQIFYTVLYHDSVAWNVVLSTYVDKGEGYLALQLFKHMQEEHVSPDQMTLITALQACPLSLDGFEYMVPMATTEGCLVASTNQGCKAICMSGGAASVLLRDGMTRAPIVKFESAQHAGELKSYNEDAIKCFKQMKCETTGGSSTWEVFDRVDKRDDLTKAQAHSKSEEVGHWAKRLAGIREVSERVNRTEDLTKVHAQTKSVEEAGNRAKRSVITEKEEMKVLWEHKREREEARERSEQLRNEASQSLALEKLEKRTQDRKTVEAQVSNMSQKKLPGLLLGARVHVVGYAMKFIYLVIYLGLAIMGFGWSAERENLVSYRTRSREPMRMGNLILVQGVLVPDSRLIVAAELKLAVHQIMFLADFQGQEDLNQVIAQVKKKGARNEATKRVIKKDGSAWQHTGWEGIDLLVCWPRRSSEAHTTPIGMQRYHNYAKMVDALLEAERGLMSALNDAYKSHERATKDD
ncbi:hypothetical protein L7F22_040830 [Adiantum nelumboides]|nr:hypothetical protein [Adiantum nelumboides]